MPPVPSIPKVRCRASGNSALEPAEPLRSPPARRRRPGSSRKLPHQKVGLSGVRTTRWVPRSLTWLPERSSIARSVRLASEAISMAAPYKAVDSLARMTFEVRPEQAEDHAAVRRVVAAAFGRDAPVTATTWPRSGRASGITAGPVWSPRSAAWWSVMSGSARAGSTPGARWSRCGCSARCRSSRNGSARASAPRWWRPPSRRRGGAAYRRCSSREPRSTTAPRGFERADRRGFLPAALERTPRAAFQCVVFDGAGAVDDRPADLPVGLVGARRRRAPRPAAWPSSRSGSHPTARLTRTSVRLTMSGMLVAPPGWPREVRPPDAPDWERYRVQLAARPVPARLPRLSRRCAGTRSCWPASRCSTSRPTRRPASAA